ncbi:unnamed protein product [Lampetra planeri]
MSGADDPKRGTSEGGNHHHHHPELFRARQRNAAYGSWTARSAASPWAARAARPGLHLGLPPPRCSSPVDSPTAQSRRECGREPTSEALAFCTDGTREQIDASELMTVQTPWSPGFKRQGPAAQHSDGSGGGGSGGGSGSGNSGGIGCSGRGGGGGRGSPPHCASPHLFSLARLHDERHACHAPHRINVRAVGGPATTTNPCWREFAAVGISGERGV